MFLIHCLHLISCATVLYFYFRYSTMQTRWQPAHEGSRHKLQLQGFTQFLHNTCPLATLHDLFRKRFLFVLGTCLPILLLILLILLFVMPCYAVTPFFLERSCLLAIRILWKTFSTRSEGNCCFVAEFPPTHI